MNVIVGVSGQEAKIAAGEGNNPELIAKKASNGGGSGDEKSAAIGKPRRFKVNAIFRNRHLLRLAAGCIHGKEPAEIVRGWLNDGNHDGLAIRGPGERQAVGENFLVVKEVAFKSSIAAVDLKVNGGGIAVLVQVGKALAIGRKGDGAVHVFDEKTGSSAQHGSVVEGSDSLLGVVTTDEVDVIAIGGKRETTVTGGRGGDDLSVAARGNVPEPEGLQAIFVQDMEQVFSIRGNSGQGDVTVVGEIFDRHAFDGQSLFVRQEGVDAKSGSGQQQNDNDESESSSKFVFSGRGDENLGARSDG